MLNFDDLQFNNLIVPSNDSSSLAKFKKMDIPKSDQISGIEMRISNIIIKDNKQEHIWPFIRYSNLYLIIVVVDDLTKEPVNLTIKGFDDVDDGDSLPVDRTIYYWKKDKNNKKAPAQVHVFCSIVKCHKATRELGGVLKSLKGKKDYKSAVSELANAITSSPVQVVDTLMTVGSVVGKLLKNVDDTPLLSIAQSFTDINGNFDALGKHSNRFENKFAQFNIKLIIRDKKREPSA